MNALPTTVTELQAEIAVLRERLSMANSFIESEVVNNARLGIQIAALKAELEQLQEKHDGTAG